MMYLKKTKMREVAKDVFNIADMPKLKDCEYRYYRGTEWLIFAYCDFFYEMCIMSCGAYLSIEKYYYDEQSGKRIQVSRSVLNGFGKHDVNIYCC